MESGFFKFLWRFNAIMIAMATTAVIGLCGVIAVELIGDRFRDRQATNVVNIDESSPTLQESFTYGTPLRRESRIIVPLQVQQRYANAGYEKSTSRNVVNYLRQNEDGSEFAPVFQGNARLITSATDLNQRTSTDEVTTHAVLLAVVATDNNGDRRLSGRDRFDLVLLRPDYSKPQVLLEDIAHSGHPHHISDDVFELTVMQTNQTKIYRFSASTGEIQTAIDLPPLPQSRKP